MGIKVNLKNVRVGWLNAFEKAPDSVAPDGKIIKGKYQVTCYLDKNDPQISKLDAVVLQVLTEGMKSAKAAEKWMDKNYGFGNHADKCAVRDLAERDKPIEGLEEGLYFKATSQKKPQIRTSLNEKQTERGLTLDGSDIEGEEVYSGCFSNLSVEVYWYDQFKTLLINFLGIRFREHGEAFGGAGEVATDDDLDDDDDKPSKSKGRMKEFTHEEKKRIARDHQDDDDEEEERPRRKRRSYEDDEE